MPVAVRGYDDLVWRNGILKDVQVAQAAAVIPRGTLLAFDSAAGTYAPYTADKAPSAIAVSDIDTTTGAKTVRILLRGDIMADKVIYLSGHTPDTVVEGDTIYNALRKCGLWLTTPDSYIYS